MGVDGISKADMFDEYFDDDKPKITNFERIKAMDIDEMEEFINRLKMNFCEDAFVAGGCNGCTIKKLCDLSKSKTRSWLESEVRE